MYKFFNKIIDLWLKYDGDKLKLAYKSDTTMPTIYKVLNKDGYNIQVISQMWIDIQDYLEDEDKLQMMVMLKLV